MSRFNRVSESKIAGACAGTAGPGGVYRDPGAGSLEPLRQYFRKPPDFKRLREKVVHSLANAPIPFTRHRMGGDGDNRHLRIARIANSARRLVAVHHGHLAIHQDQVVLAVLQRFDSLRAAGDRVGLVPKSP